MFDLNDDEFVLATVKPFKDVDKMRGKNIAVAISFSWMDCLHGEINPEASIGLPITLRDRRMVSHELYICALIDLLSRHNFGQLKFILAGELQWSNLMTARGENFDDIAAKQRALDDLFLLEKKWIQKFSPLISEKLAGKEVTCEHWRNLIQEQGCEEQTLLFQELKKGSNIKKPYDKEVKDACTREKNKKRVITPESVHMYLDEEIPVLMNQVSPQYPNKIDYFLYPAKVDVMINTFNALPSGHGVWQEIGISIRTKDYILSRWRSNNKKCIITAAEGLALTTIDELTAYVRVCDQMIKSSTKSKNSPFLVDSDLVLKNNQLNQDENDLEKEADEYHKKSKNEMNSDFYQLSSITTAINVSETTIELSACIQGSNKTEQFPITHMPLRKTSSGLNSKYLSTLNFFSKSHQSTSLDEGNDGLENEEKQLLEEVHLVSILLHTESFKKSGIAPEIVMRKIEHILKEIREVRALLSSELDNNVSSPHQMWMISKN